MKQDNNTTQPSSSHVLGRYQILRRIGKGGMGDVWLAEDPSLHRQVAIKTLPIHNQNDREFSLRFAREAQAAAALNHPHILSIHDFGEQPLASGQSITYIVMPYISGGSLADKIAVHTTNKAEMPTQEALLYLQQAAEAIDYAHSQGVVHRDIKPGNMLLRPDNWLLLADFGIAHMLSNQERMTQVGVGIGTPEYMAPEQAQGKAEAASDNYSLAVIAYQLFTQHLPFTADTGYAMTMQHILMTPPAPHDYNPSLSPTFEAALLQGMAKEPQQRPPSALAFVADLQRAVTGTPFEPTYVKRLLPATLVDSKRTPAERGLHQEALGTNNAGELRGKQTGMTRRRMLIGSGATAAVLVAGGIGAWTFASNRHIFSKGQISSTPAIPLPTASLSDPTLILLGHAQPVTSLGWSPKTNTLASAGAEGNIFLWDVESLAQQKGQPLLPSAKQSFGANNNIFVAWSPDGNAIAVGNAAGDLSANTTSVYVYQKDLRTFVQGYEKPILVPGVISIEALSWTKNKYIVTLDLPESFIGKSQFNLRLWDTTQPSLQLQPALLSGDLAVFFTSNPALLSASPNNTLLALAMDNGAIVGEASVSGNAVRWQQRSSILSIKTDGFAQEIDGIGWSSSGKYIVGFYQNIGKSIINGWPWQDKKPTSSTVNIPDAAAVLTTLAVCTAPSSTLIAAGGKKGTVYIWNVNKNLEPVQTLHGEKANNAAVGALEWSADGKWLAASYQDVNASILVWNVDSLKI